jgi:hypothetical protein
MPQINSGKSPPWVSGEIVTAVGLNGMIDSATIDPSVITAQSNLATLTGDEYTLIVDPSTGLLNKTQLKKALLTGKDIKTDLISQITGSSTLMLIQSNPSVAMMVDGIGGLTLRSQSSNIGIDTTSAGGSGSLYVQSNGMTFDGQGGGATGVIDFQTRTTFSYTSAVKIPVGTTAQRPASPVAGDFRFNSTTTDAEVYNGSAWKSFNPVESSALTANGFIKLPNGLILQWGTSAVGMANYSAQTINFPTAFATACFSVQITAKTATVMTSGSVGYENGIKLNGNPTTTSFSVYCNWSGSHAGGIVYPTWFAIGI